jgi:hypothetical protein
MNSQWAWFALALGVQLTVTWIFPQRVNKGKILTQPIVRFFPQPWLARTSQIFANYGAYELCRYGLNLPVKPLNVIYWTVYIALYMDDYLTGDDDKWKKFKDAVKNKIKWLMDLPKEPVPIPIPVEKD